jgi:hypothetical protein
MAEKNSIFSQNIVRCIALAFLLNLLLIYTVNKVLPDLISGALAFIVILIIAYLISTYISDKSVINVAMIGAVSYLGYNLLVISLKIAEVTEIVFKDEVIAAVIFGAITAVVHLVLNSGGVKS